MCESASRCFQVTTMHREHWYQNWRDTGPILPVNTPTPAILLSIIELRSRLMKNCPRPHDTAELPRLEGKHLAFWLIGYISYVRVSIICERHSRDDMLLFIQYPSTCITDALMRRCIESPKDSIKVNVTARHCRHCTRYKSEKCSQSTQIWQLCSAAPVVGAHHYCFTFCTLTARAQTIKSWIQCYSYMLYVFNEI